MQILLIAFLIGAYFQQVDTSTTLLDDANRQALSHSVAAPSAAANAQAAESK